MARYYFALIAGVLACSTSAILIKSSHTDPALLSSLRLAISALVLLPLALRDYHALFGVQRSALSVQRSVGIPPPVTRHPLPVTLLRRTILPGLVLSAHFLTWTVGARLTIAAQASLVVNLIPVAMPFFLHFLVGERITRGEIAGTLLAIAGVAVLSARDALSGNGNAAGNIVCFVSMIFFAWYLALGRRNRDFPSLWLYLVPVYAIASLTCFLAAIPHLSTFDYHSSREWLLILGLVVFPTLLGHNLLNRSMRHLRGQIVVLCNSLQFLGAALLGWFIFSEHPTPTFYLAATISLTGVVLVVLLAPPDPKPAPSP